MPGIRSRSDAGLAPPRSRLSPASRLRSHFFLHHTVTPVSADQDADWRKVQQIAFSRGFTDISYTFGVHPNGTILEGRSPAAVGAHTSNYNSRAHAVVLIGNYETMDPTEEMIQSVRWLREWMVQNGLLTPSHTFGYHRQVSATACPGKKAYENFGAFLQPFAPPPDVHDPPPPHDAGDFAGKVRMKPHLRRGSSGQDVLILQALLIVAARDLVLHHSRGDLNAWVDGAFGPGTEAVLAGWQDRAGGLGHERGSCGPDTWAWLIGV